MNMKVIICAALLLMSACSFFPGAEDKLEDLCARWPQLKADSQKAIAFVDGQCSVVEE